MKYYFDSKDFQVAHKINEEILSFKDFNEHFHIVYEFLLFIEGELEYVIENEKYILKPYDLLLIRPGQHHYINFKKTKGKYERFVINFGKSLIPLHILSSFNKKEQCISIKNTPMLSLFERFDQYRASFDGEDLYELSKGLITELVIYYNKFALDVKDEETHPLVSPIIQEVIKYISQNIDKDLSIKTLCKKFGISQSILCSTFKECMQINISKYIKSKRIILAHSYILRGEKPTDVYEKCGFIDYSTFYRCYIKIMGYPPSKKVG